MEPKSWLLLRGLAREQRHWGEFVPALRAALPGAQVHCLDLPGAGTEHARASPVTVRAIAEDVRARWLALRAPQPAGLIAVSLGGMVAISLCAAHPDDFETLVLANTSAGGVSPFWKRIDPRVLPHIARALLEDAVARERRILSLTVSRKPDDLPAQWAAFHAERPMSRWTVLRQLAAASRFRAPLKLAPRTLVVSSAADRFTHPDCPRALAKRFGAQLAVHPDAGHDIATDDPRWLAEQVKRFSGG